VDNSETSLETSLEKRTTPLFSDQVAGQWRVTDLSGTNGQSEPSVPQTQAAFTIAVLHFLVSHTGSTRTYDLETHLVVLEESEDGPGMKVIRWCLLTLWNVPYMLRFKMLKNLSTVFIIAFPASIHFPGSGSPS
jgi:hypothetical protein